MGHPLAQVLASGTRRATLTDVARAAGVSTSTVSLTFSGAGPVSASTRARVLQAAELLGYRGPDPVARSLRRGRCGVVAVAIGDRLGQAFSDPMLVAVLDGLADEVAAIGASLLLVPIRRLDGQGAEQLSRLPMDAAVLLDCELPAVALLDSLQARGTAVVGLDSPPGTGIPVVGIDDEGDTARLVDHLVDLGHRELGLVTLPLAPDDRGGPIPDAGDAADPEDTARLRGAAGVPRRRLLAARAATAARADVRLRAVEARRNLGAEGERAAGLLLDTHPRPTALLAQSDVLAQGCLRAAAVRGLAVPADLSVTGFDGIAPYQLGAGAWPPVDLTTIVQPATEKGRTAGRLVAQLLDGRVPDDVRLPTELRVGTTSGPPRP